MPTNKPKAESVQTLSVNKTIAVAVLLSLAVVVISGFAIKALVSSIAFNGRVIDKKNIANDRLKANFVAVNILAESYSKLGNKVQLINDALPTTPDFPSIVASMEAIAGSSGVRLKSVAAADVLPAGSAGDTAPRPYAYNVSVSGNYDNLLRFFSNIELSSRPIKLLGLTQTGSSAVQVADLKLQTYYQTAVSIAPKSEVVK